MVACIFCQLIQASDPDRLVHADDTVVVFPDIRPQAPTHLLVVPRGHIATIVDADPEVVAAMTRAVATVTRSLGLVQPGFRLVINTGDDGGQTVAHLHMHLLAGRRLTWPPG